MPVPISQAWTVASYVLKQKLNRQKQYPLVLMLEPLYRCNLACAGCGKIQYPAHVLKRELSPEECFQAVDEFAERRDRGRPGGAEEIHLPLHKRVVAKGKTTPFQAKQVPDIFCARGWAEGT